jgi:hypothetical protein
MTTTTTDTAPVLDITEAVSKTYVQTMAHGGATVSLADPDGAIPGRYVVSLPDAEDVVWAPVFTPTAIHAYVDAHAERLSQPGIYLGTWMHGDQVFIDLSVTFDDLTDATEFGIRGKQFAIWDRVEHAEIRLPSWQGYAE